MGVRIGGYIVLALVLMLSVQPSSRADVLSEPSPDEVLESSNFRIESRPNYQGAFWIVAEKNRKIIGYAPWDAVSRRWTLFNLKGQYRGFLQATIGTPAPPHYTEYLYYDRNNRYKGVYIAELGGRPVTRDLPYGELGGGLVYYAFGNIPVPLPEVRIEVDPLKRFPEDVDISPLTPSPSR